jgi:hypothetical protein
MPRTIKVGYYSLLNLGSRFRQQTSAERKKRTERTFTVGRPFSWRWIEQLLLLVTKQSNGYQNKKENRPQKDRRHRILI